MPDILRDPLWQFVGALLALVAILVSLGLYQIQRGRKELSYEMISRTRLLSVAEELQGKLQILFENTPVSKVDLVVLRLTNTGNTPVTSTDYEREVSFKFGEGVRILTAEVSETIPENLRASVVLDDSRIVIQPALLNGGDSVTVKALLSQYDCKIEVDGRIVGVKRIGQKRESMSWVFLVYGGSALLSVVIGFLIAESMPTLTRMLPQFAESSPLILLVAYIIVAVLLGALQSLLYSQTKTHIHNER